jgi:hypothetical protein
VKPSITLRLTPPRRDSTYANLWGEIFNAPITEATTIWEDIQSAIAYSEIALVNEKTKHIGMKFHFLKDDHVERGTIKLRYLPTDQMVADMFIKPLPTPKTCIDKKPKCNPWRRRPNATLHPVATFRGCCK